MFSAIPMPQFVWTKENMRYIMCAFPLVGVIIGGCISLWAYMGTSFSFGNVLFSVGITIIPVLITGGIHLDGFCDTVDALASHAPKARKLEILKDPHSGAFAIIGVVVYFLLYLALATEVRFSFNVVFALSLGHILSRCYSALAIATFPCAKNSGLAHTFADMSAKKVVRVMMLLSIVLLSIISIIKCGYYGVGLVLVPIVVFFIYYRVSLKNFDGITGDLAGWFLQICEISILASMVLIQKIF